MAGTTDPRERRILCTSCDAPLKVDAEAKSVNCPLCNQRVVTEAVTIKGYVAVRRYPVANRITITRKGIVYASLRADDLEIDGVLRGEALVLGCCHLRKHARVTAPIRASMLRVDKGASLVGDVHIGPEAVGELDALVHDSTPTAGNA
jgi:LSD1 subclass zinc finger protein